MWYCSQCGEEIEDTFEACWNCGTGEDGIVDYDFKPTEPPGEELGNAIDVAPHSAQLVQALEFSNVNLGLGKIAVPLLLMLFFSGLAAAVLFSWLESEDGTARSMVLWMSGGMTLLLGWKVVSEILSTPLKIRIADKVTVRYLLHAREWESYQLRTIRFFHFVRLMWLLTVPVPTSRYQVANLTFGEEGEEVEFFVTPEEELELRLAFEAEAYE